MNRIKEEIIFDLVNRIEPLNEIKFTDDFIEKYFKPSTHKFIRSISRITVRRDWSEKYNHKLPLYYKTNDYSFIENGIYYLALEDYDAVGLSELYSILLSHYDWEKNVIFSKALKILKDSNQFTIPELIHIQEKLNKDI